MQVLMLSSTYRPEVRGVATVIEQYIISSARRGHDVNLITRRFKKTPPYERLPHVFIYRVRPAALSWSSYPLFLIKQFLVARRLIKKLKFDIIHVITNSSILPAVFLKLLYGLPIIISLIGIPTEPLLRRAKPTISDRFKYRLNQVILSILLQASNLVIVPSHFAKKFFLNFYGKRLNSKIIVIPRCVNTDDFHPKTFTGQKTSYPNILNVGALSYRKGIDILLRAMPLVLRKHPQAKLKIVGSGNASEYLRLAEKLKVLSAVLFLGEVPHENVSPFYHDADIFVLPSRRFGDVFPNAILEAMASGKPIITTKIGIPTSLVKEGKTGLLVEAENPKELAEAIIQLASNKKLLQKMGDNGRRLIEGKYSLDLLGERLEKVYQAFSVEKNQ